MTKINKYSIFYFNLHLYPDNDKYGDIIEDIYNVIYPYGATLYEHRNVYPGEKDFGVPIERISENIVIHT